MMTGKVESDGIHLDCIWLGSLHRSFLINTILSIMNNAEKEHLCHGVGASYHGQQQYMLVHPRSGLY